MQVLNKFVKVFICLFMYVSVKIVTNRQYVHVLAILTLKCLCVMMIFLGTFLFSYIGTILKCLFKHIYWSSTR